MRSEPTRHGELVIFPFSRRLARDLGNTRPRPRRPWGGPALCSKRGCTEVTTVMVRIEDTWTARCASHLPRWSSPGPRRRPR